MSGRIIIWISVFIVLDSAIGSTVDITFHKLSASPGGILSVTCHANKPITRCEFYSQQFTNPIILTEQDYKQRLNQTYQKRYTYNGNGFKSGDCGIFIPFANDTHNGQWKCIVGLEDQTTRESDFFTFNVSDTLSDDVLSAIPLQTFRNETSPAFLFICHANRPIKNCSIKPPRKDYNIPFQNSSFPLLASRWDANIRTLYFGRGLQNGDCGLYLKSGRVHELGEWTCKVEFEINGVGLEQTVSTKGSTSEAIPSVPAPNNTPGITSDSNLTETSTFTAATTARPTTDSEVDVRKTTAKTPLTDLIDTQTKMNSTKEENSKTPAILVNSMDSQTTTPQAKSPSQDIRTTQHGKLPILTTEENSLAATSSTLPENDENSILIKGIVLGVGLVLSVILIVTGIAVTVYLIIKKNRKDAKRDTTTKEGRRNSISDTSSSPRRPDSLLIPLESEPLVYNPVSQNPRYDQYSQPQDRHIYSEISDIIDPFNKHIYAEVPEDHEYVNIQR